MILPKHRLTITLAEHRLLKPALDVLANGLVSAKAGHFPNRHPWHRIDYTASDVFNDREFDAEMSARIIGVRGKLWDLSQSRKIHFDVFELLALALAVRLSRSQKLVDGTESTSSEIKLLQAKIEIYRRRARRSAITRIGGVAYQSAAQRWRRFIEWLRYNILYIKVPKRGAAWRAARWREQRMQLTELMTKVLRERFFEAPSEAEMTRVVTLATTSLRRCRHSVGLRELLRSPQGHTDFLFGFVEKRVALKRVPGAPVPPWQAMSDRADKFREYQIKNRRKPPELSTISRDKIITEQQDHRAHTPQKAKTRRQYTHQGQVLTAEILVSAMAGWLYQNVTIRYNFTTEVCEQAKFQIKHDLLDAYRVKTVATSFNGLMKELRPMELSDDSAILISEIAGWLLGCLLATGQQPAWMYQAFGAAMIRAEAMKKKESYDEWAATLANGSSRDSVGA